MPRYRRNNYDLQDLRVGDEIIWNEREETAEVINVDAPFEDDPNHPMHKRTTVTVETVRGTEYDLFQNEMSGDEVKRASSYDKEPLRYVEIV